MHSFSMINCPEVCVCFEGRGWGCIVQYTYLFAKDTGRSSRSLPPPSTYLVPLKPIPRLSTSSQPSHCLGMGSDFDRMFLEKQS